MAPRILSCCLAALALAGCGAEEEPSAPSGAPATELTVRVDPDGDGPKPVKESQVRDAAGLRPADLEPVPDDVACTEQFGGPQTATIKGTLDGRQVDARFARNNGCEIARWEKAAPLLEANG
jgi:hypothetical protein